MTGLGGAGVMLDTNVFSYLSKNHPLASSYLPLLQGRVHVLSFITVGELFFWAEDSRWGARRRAEQEAKLRNYVIVPSDHEIARHYGLVAAERKRQGRPISLNDAWLAACALRHGLPLMTHNAKDFEGISGLEVITVAGRSTA